MPLYLCFYLLNSLNELVNLHNSTHGVYLELLFEDSAKGLFYVNNYLRSISSCLLLFGFFLCRLPLVAVWLVGQPLCGLLLDQILGFFGRQVLSHLEFLAS